MSQRLIKSVKHLDLVLGVRRIEMPFKSESQRRFMFANKPKMAKEWAAVTPKGKKLPKRAPKKRVKK